MKKIKITYKELYDLFGNGNHEEFCSLDEEIFVKTPRGEFTKINGVICKHNNNVIRLDFEDEYFECSENHLLSKDDEQVIASDVWEIDSIYGKKQILEKTPIGVETVYDIGINFPHWYIATQKSGIIHHNTAYALSAAREFLNNNKKGSIIYFDTEGATDEEQIKNFGIDATRIEHQPIRFIEELSQMLLTIAEEQIELSTKDREPLMLIIDSIGNLSTSKEVADLSSGNDKVDMTKAKKLTAMFRAVTVLLTKAEICTIFTNHVYDTQDLFAKKVMKGGKSIVYCASTIIQLSKKKDKEGTEVVGNIIKASAVKARKAKENAAVNTYISYKNGVIKHFGLVELAESVNLIKRVGNKYEFPSGQKLFLKDIFKNPEAVFTKEFLIELNTLVKSKFNYGDHETFESDESE